MTARAIVLDANILVRAVLGTRVSELFAAHAAQATFLAPDIAFDEAREHLPTVLAKRGNRPRRSRRRWRSWRPWLA